MAHTSKAFLVLFSVFFLVCSSMTIASRADECADAKTQTDMSLCAAGVSKKVRSELESVYNKLMEKISPDDKKKLIEAQSAWLEYVKKQCEFNTSGSIGGSVHSMVVSYCHAYLANMQKKVLLEQLECEEGDLSCSGHGKNE